MSGARGGSARLALGTASPGPGAGAVSSPVADGGPVAGRPRTCGDSGGRTATGEPCRTAFGLNDAGLCLFHDVARAEIARVGRLVGARRGGEASRVRKIMRDTSAPEDLPKFAPDSLERLSLWHQWVVKSVACGAISPQVAREVTCSLKELRPTLAAIGLEARVRELEAKLRQYQRRGGER